VPLAIIEYLPALGQAPALASEPASEPPVPALPPAEVPAEPPVDVPPLPPTAAPPVPAEPPVAPEPPLAPVPLPPVPLLELSSLPQALTIPNEINPRTTATTRIMTLCQLAMVLSIGRPRCLESAAFHVEYSGQHHDHYAERDEERSQDHRLFE
jgi:hypothetical protein